LRAATANVLNAAYTMSAINTVDNSIIDWDSGITDATQTIGAINITNTGGTAVENDVPARLRFNFTNSRLRNYLKTGVITLNGTAAIDVNWGAGTTNGTNSGVIAAGLAGSKNLLKWGPGYLWINGSNSSFTGNVFIEQGALGVLDNGALGTTANNVTVRRYGVLDVGVAGYNPTSTIAYETGGIERWSVNGARSYATDTTLAIGSGTLQINADQTTNAHVTVSLNGGGIEGFIAAQGDSAITANGNAGVFRTVGSGVSFLLNGSNTIGQNLTDGVNGLDNGRAPQSCKLFNGQGNA
jgi:autotransporter-associated beta strand protein